MREVVLKVGDDIYNYVSVSFRKEGDDVIVRVTENNGCLVAKSRLGKAPAEWLRDLLS